MIVTLTNRDKTISVQTEVDSLEALVVEKYKMALLENMGDLKTDQDLFKALSDLNNIDSIKHENCGKCNGSNVVHRVRDVDGNQFYEKICLDCWAKLSFGSHKKPQGSLFGKRKNEDGSKRGDRGWVKFNKDSGKEE